MKKFTKKGGFTLIELLVVIAIIGILASIVLVSLNGARKKGADARIISDVQEVRTALETGYNGTAYPDLTNNSTVGNYNSTCTATNYNNAGPDAANINALISDACSQGAANDLNIVTGNPAAPAGATTITAYAIYGKLSSNASVAMCIDSTGKTNASETTFTTITCQ